jgi:hypothetical protein
MKSGLIILCCGALFSMAALADDKAESKSSGGVFASLDTDGDGKVSKSEAEANHSFATNFDKLDGNSDGFVTKREFQRNTVAKPKAGSSY